MYTCVIITNSYFEITLSLLQVFLMTVFFIALFIVTVLFLTITHALWVGRRRWYAKYIDCQSDSQRGDIGCPQTQQPDIEA